MRRDALVYGLWLCGLAALGQQPERCAVEGLVLRAASGEPVRKAQVLLRKLDARDQSYSTATDERGRFLLTGLEPGRYALSAERNGYVPQDYGQRRANQPGATLTLQPGQHLRDIVFHLVPFGVISGRAADEDGEPVPRVRIQAMRVTHQSGRRELIAIASGTSDDRGEYRVFGLPPGRYYVSAAPAPSSRPGAPESDEEGFVPFYYPGVIDPGQAAPLELRAGSEIQGVDFRLTRTRTVRVRGRVLNAATGRLERGIVVFLLPRGSGSAASAPRNQNAVVDAQGSFEIRGVAPGSYVLSAYQADQQRRFFARQPIDVGAASLEGISLVLGPGLEIAGRIRFEGSGGRLDLVRVTLQSRSESAGSAFAAAKSDGTFSLQNVAADWYTLSIAGLVEDCYLKSARFGGVDALERGLDLSRGDPPGPLEVVLSPAGGHIEGVALKENQPPAAGATVALAPDAQRRSQAHLFRSAVADQYGRYVLRGIPPGEYRLFAWEDVEPGAWLDPDFLSEYEKRGETVSVDERGRYTVQLKAIE
jgi:Carboxypeptidase regulatory-like domain